jgi:hypothetical protein
LKSDTAQKSFGATTLEKLLPQNVLIQPKNFVLAETKMLPDQIQNV